MALPTVLQQASETQLPATVETELQAARAFALASKARSSRRAYSSDWRQFEAWCSARGLDSLPSRQDTVSRYLADMANQGYSPNTIGRRSAAIGYRHRLENLEPPTNSEMVKAVISGIRREVGHSPTRKAPVTADVIRKLLAQLPLTTIGFRDRALLLLGFAGAFRRSELVALTIEDLERTEHGLIVHLRRSKTDQEGEGRTVAIPAGGKLRAIEAIDAWIAEARITTGPLFRSVHKTGAISDEGLSDQSVALIVKRYAERAGLDPQLFSGHSLRAGFVTSALDNGADPLRVMDVTGHTEVRTLRVYDRRSKFEKHAGKNFL